MTDYKFKKHLLTAALVLVLLTFFAQNALSTNPGYKSDTSAAQDQESLQYQVSVDALLVPLFAVDSTGRPVYDLKIDELELYVNGKPQKITSFIGYTFEHPEELPQEPTTGVKKEPAAATPGRVIFIIIDSVFNSIPGTRRSREIATALINSAAKNDRIVVIENTPGGGLKHIGGPDQDRDLLIRKIEKIMPAQQHSPNRFITSQGEDFSPAQSTSTPPPANQYSKHYKIAAMHFSHVLSRFEYALKTITRPKIVFLISEGIAKGAFEEDSGLPSGIADSTVYTKKFLNPRLFSYLKNIVKAVNHGGSVLYTVNPQSIAAAADEKASGEFALKYLAGESGGQYFAGSDIPKIVKRIKKTTAAYYELAFSIPPDVGEQLELTVKSKRPNVRIHTLSFTQRNLPYKKMKPVQKKVFALNVAIGGSWSRLAAKISTAKYRITKTGKKQYTIDVRLPSAIKGRPRDVFVLHIDPKTDAVDMTMDSLGADTSRTLELKIPRKKNKKCFFVVIEPQGPRCIYNEVR
jgi:VWFA-related protein